MKKLFPLVLFQILLVYGVFSQGWEKTFGGRDFDAAHDIVPTADCGYMMVGESFSRDSNDRSDLYLVKTDSIGNVIWEKYFGGDKSEIGRSIAKVDDGYILAGDTAIYGNAGGYLLKVDEDGNEIWSRYFPRRIFRSVEKTMDGGLIIGGAGWEPTNWNTRMYLMKTDANGLLQWEKTFFTKDDSHGKVVLQTKDGGYIIAGSDRQTSTHKAYLVKANAEGTMLWQKTFGNSAFDWFDDVAETNDGGFILTGMSTPSTFVQIYDLYIVKTDKNGNMQWERHFDGPYGGPFDGYGNAVIQTKDGDFLITGNKKNGSFDDLILMKIDNKGNLLWEKNYGGAGNDLGYEIIQTSDGEYLIAGTTSSHNFEMKNYEVYLIKIDKLGMHEEGCNANRFIDAKVYPNPCRFSTTFELTWDGTPGSVQLLLFDIIGHQVINNSYAGDSFEVITKDLRAGIYYYRILANKDLVVQGKLVVVY